MRAIIIFIAVMIVIVLWCILIIGKKKIPKRFLVLILLLATPVMATEWNSHVDLDTTSQWELIIQEPIPDTPLIVSTFKYPKEDVKIIQTLTHHNHNKILAYMYLIEDEIYFWVWNGMGYEIEPLNDEMKNTSKQFFKEFKRIVNGKINL